MHVPRKLKTMTLTIKNNNDMKVGGWICLVIGLLSFLGAATKGDSVFGPCFFIALGAFLLYRVNNRKSKSDDNQGLNLNPESQDTVNIKPVNLLYSPSNKENKKYETKKDNLIDIQANLSLEQREAAMCLIAFFGGFCNDFNDDAPILIFKHAATFFGLSDNPDDMFHMMKKYQNADNLIDTVLTIKQHKAKEFLLLSCYDLTKLSGNYEAKELFQNITTDMGYNKEQFQQLITKYNN